MGFGADRVIHREPRRRVEAALQHGTGAGCPGPPEPPGRADRPALPKRGGMEARAGAVSCRHYKGIVWIHGACFQACSLEKIGHLATLADEPGEADPRSRLPRSTAPEPRTPNDQRRAEGTQRGEASALGTPDLIGLPSCPDKAIATRLDRGGVLPSALTGLPGRVASDLGPGLVRNPGSGSKSCCKASFEWAHRRLCKRRSGRSNILIFMVGLGRVPDQSWCESFPARHRVAGRWASSLGGVLRESGAVPCRRAVDVRVGPRLARRDSGA